MSRVWTGGYGTVRMPKLSSHCGSFGKRSHQDTLEAPASCAGATGPQSAAVDVKSTVDGVELRSSGGMEHGEGLEKPGVTAEEEDIKELCVTAHGEGMERPYVTVEGEEGKELCVTARGEEIKMPCATNQETKRRSLA